MAELERLAASDRARQPRARQAATGRVQLQAQRPVAQRQPSRHRHGRDRPGSSRGQERQRLGCHCRRRCRCCRYHQLLGKHRVQHAAERAQECARREGPERAGQPSAHMGSSGKSRRCRRIVVVSQQDAEHDRWLLGLPGRQTHQRSQESNRYVTSLDYDLISQKTNWAQL